MDVKTVCKCLLLRKNSSTLTITLAPLNPYSSSSVRKKQLFQFGIFFQNFLCVYVHMRCGTLCVHFPLINRILSMSHAAVSLSPSPVCLRHFLMLLRESGPVLLRILCFSWQGSNKLHVDVVLLKHARVLIFFSLSFLLLSVEKKRSIRHGS